jgi:hypothetical protein
MAMDLRFLLVLSSAHVVSSSSASAIGIADLALVVRKVILLILSTEVAVMVMLRVVVLTQRLGIAVVVDRGGIGPRSRGVRSWGVLRHLLATIRVVGWR